MTTTTDGLAVARQSAPPTIGRRHNRARYPAEYTLACIIEGADLLDRLAPGERPIGRMNQVSFLLVRVDAELLRFLIDFQGDIDGSEDGNPGGTDIDHGELCVGDEGEPYDDERQEGAALSWPPSKETFARLISEGIGDRRGAALFGVSRYTCRALRRLHFVDGGSSKGTKDGPPIDPADYSYTATSLPSEVNVRRQLACRCCRSCREGATADDRAGARVVHRGVLIGRGRPLRTGVS